MYANRIENKARLYSFFFFKKKGQPDAQSLLHLRDPGRGWITEGFVFCQKLHIMLVGKELHLLGVLLVHVCQLVGSSIT